MRYIPGAPPAPPAACNGRLLLPHTFVLHEWLLINSKNLCDISWIGSVHSRVSSHTICMDSHNTDRYYDRSTHVIAASSPRDSSTVVSKDDGLDIVVHAYHIRDAAADGITWIMTHGTSFNKYFWRLIIDDLLKRPFIRANTARILAMDAVNHGDSAVRNRTKLTDKSRSANPPSRIPNQVHDSSTGSSLA